ncbi:MAG: helix-turn-helix transcriptional regulator [Lachnospiraceae bacterium]|nr:helix-turn-helix transcriptional regulator [Lachnospiraceae bacterium]
MEKGNITLEEKENMPAPTFIVSNEEKELIDQMVSLRKEQNLSQKQLAEITGNKQQAISRIEKKEHSPSLQTFCNILNALGYGLAIEKKVIV